MISFNSHSEGRFKTQYSNEQPHEKINEMTVRPVKTQISLGIRPVWPESSLCAQWVAKNPIILRADSEDSDQAGRTCRFVGFLHEAAQIMYVCYVCGQNHLNRIELILTYQCINIYHHLKQIFLKVNNCILTIQ